MMRIEGEIGVGPVLRFVSAINAIIIVVVIASISVERQSQ